MTSTGQSARVAIVVASLGCIAMSSLPLAPAYAQEGGVLPKGFQVTPLLKSGKTADGDALRFPQTAKPEIVSVIGTLEPGGRTALHQHPVPVYVYVMDGALEVQTEGRDVRTYQAGQAFLESVGHWHQAFNKTDRPTKLLVVFLAEEGKPTTQNRQ